MLYKKPSLVGATSTGSCLRRLPAIQVDRLLMVADIWCPATVDQTVQMIRATSTASQGLEIARSTGYRRKSTA